MTVRVYYSNPDGSAARIVPQGRSFWMTETFYGVRSIEEAQRRADARALPHGAVAYVQNESDDYGSDEDDRRAERQQMGITC